MTCVITTVHGTFAPKSAWSRQESIFCRALCRTLSDRTVIINPFDWTGRNTLGGRRDASDGPRRALEDAHRSFPDAEHSVIAHSHGANVAISALSDTTGCPNVKGLICLGASFLRYRERRTTRLGTGIGLGVWFISTTVMALIAASATWWNSAMFLIAAQLALGWSYVRGFPIVGDVLGDQAVQGRGTPILLLRSEADEASSALTAMQFGGWLTDATWQRVDQIGRQILIWSLREAPTPTQRRVRTMAIGAFMFGIVTMFGPDPIRWTGYLC
jgi:hypothetical protein